MKIYLSIVAFLCHLVAFSQTGVLNNFSSNSTSGLSTATPANYALSVANQELTVNTNKSGFQNFEFNFNAINIIANPVLTVRVRSAAAFTLRIDLKDANGNTTNATPTTQNVTASGTYQTYTFNFTGRFSQSFPSNATVNSAAITGMVIFFNAGGTFNGTVLIDDIQLGDPIPFTPGKILINQIGYELKGPKKAIFQIESPSLPSDSFYLLTHPGNVLVYKEALGEVKTVTGWTGRYFSEMDFSPVDQSGSFRLRIGGNYSYPFKIEFNLLFNETAQKVVEFFNGMRNTMSADLTLSFNGPRNDAVNVYGGWSDATGDPGKHMSHLSYANFFNPQQIPMVSWSMMKAYELYPDGYLPFETALKAEVAWGTDYIVRNVDPAGYMYLSIFDDWGGAPATREITEWGQGPACDYCRTPNYQAAMREGTGIAIAALARAHATNITGTLSAQYLTSAVTLYNHLKQPGTGYATKNLEYCNNHEENLLDYYCGLMAATELYKATNTPVYLTDAQNYVDLILALQHAEGWLYSDNAKTRPFFHAADEGLPIMALEEFSAVSNYKLADISTFMTKWYDWYKNISTEITNPFDYVRQYGRPYTAGTMGAARKSFFVPKANETGYWWQGENARIASMASAFWAIHRFNGGFYDIDTTFATKFAIGQLDWIFGRNPFDLCMMTGVGTTTYPSYLNGQKGFNTIGGICNGITSMTGNENNIAWMPFDQGAPDAWQNWRWIEQWLPHDSWYLLAIGYLSKYNNEPNLLSVRNNQSLFQRPASKQSQARLFPNPCVGGRFVLQGLEGEAQQATLHLKNSSGKLMHTQEFVLSPQPYEFEIANLNPGVYILAIETEKGIETTKLTVLE